MRELIERNYVKQLRTNLNYQVLYKDETGARKFAILWSNSFGHQIYNEA